MDKSTLSRTITALKQGGLVVVRTDTIYGIIALAANEQAVEAVYTAKQRDSSKQCIVLLTEGTADTPYLDQIKIHSDHTKRPTSVIVPASSEPRWLLRGGNSVAYRLVRDPFLKEVIDAVGPVIAPSANPENLPPAQNIAEAKAYFNDRVALYVDGGQVPDGIQPSRIVRISSDGTHEEVLR